MANKLTLAEMRAKFAEQGKRGKGNFESDNAGFPFWNIPDNSTATIRFLPDGDDSNGYFWVERAVIKLPFPGTKGGDAEKPVFVQVPSMKMYGKTCPITEEIKPWWKGSEDDQKLAREYYRKLSYLYQGFVVNSPLKEETTPENPIRRLIINKSIHDKIKAGLMDPDIEDMPTDYANGRDFRLTKTKQGQYANYDSSSFSMKTRGLTEDELAAIEAHKLFTLKDFLPKEPDEKTLALIMEMFEASVANQLFDAEKFKQFRSSGGGATTTTDEVAETKASTRTTTTKTEEAPAEPKVNKLKETADEAEAGSKPKKSPADVLAMLRERKAKGESK